MLRTGGLTGPPSDAAPELLFELEEALELELLLEPGLLDEARRELELFDELEALDAADSELESLLDQLELSEDAWPVFALLEGVDAPPAVPCPPAPPLPDEPHATMAEHVIAVHAITNLAPSLDLITLGLLIRSLLTCGGARIASPSRKASIG